MRLFFAIVFCLQSFLSMAQSDVKAVVASNIKVGNISELSSYFTDNIDISIDEVDAIQKTTNTSLVKWKQRMGRIG